MSQNQVPKNAEYRGQTGIVFLKKTNPFNSWKAGRLEGLIDVARYNGSWGIGMKVNR